MYAEGFLTTRTNYNSGNKCVHQRLAGLSGSTSHSRTVDASWSYESYKCAGTLSCLPGKWDVGCHYQGQVVQVLIDNNTAVFYLSKQVLARSSQPCQEVIYLWNFCIKNSVLPNAFQLPRVRNNNVDAISRNFIDHHKWSIEGHSAADLSSVVIYLVINNQPEQQMQEILSGKVTVRVPWQMPFFFLGWMIPSSPSDSKDDQEDTKR